MPPGYLTRELLAAENFVFSDTYSDLPLGVDIFDEKDKV